MDGVLKGQIAVIVGVGSDIVEIQRIKDALSRHGQAFEQRVLSVRERGLAGLYGDDRRAEFIAGRFAAKEAIAKAVGCGIAKLCMAEVTIMVGDGGLFVEADRPSAIAHFGSADGIHVTISHTRETAVAFAVYERLDDA